MTHETDCPVCAACARRGITDEARIAHIHHFVDATAALLDTMIEAEDDGFDMDDADVTSISDELFDQSPDPKSLN